MYEFYFWFIYIPFRSLWLRWKYRNETPEQTAARRKANELRTRALWAEIQDKFKDTPETREMLEARELTEMMIESIYSEKDEEKARIVVDKL